MFHLRNSAAAAAKAHDLARALALAGTVALLALATEAPAQQAQTQSPELQKARDALAKYKDPLAAVRDGYFSTVGCVHYKEGAMGVHFLNPALISPKVDPEKPQILIYEPKGDRLELVAAEWFVPLATGVDKRPVLFERPFDGPMAGHEPLMPAGLHHYDLHVWLFKDNPAGMFATTNPNVSCEKHGYALLEEPPPTVPHHGAGHTPSR
jgi:hypothetical protein